MIVEFVGGPWDGEVRDIDERQSANIFAPEPRKLTEDEKSAINYREGFYEYRTWSKDGSRVAVWQGWR